MAMWALWVWNLASSFSCSVIVVVIPRILRIERRIVGGGRVFQGWGDHQVKHCLGHELHEFIADSTAKSHLNHKERKEHKEIQEKYPRLSVFVSGYFQNRP